LAKIEQNKLGATLEPATGHQGDQLGWIKTSPKCSPTHFLLRLMHVFYSRRKTAKKLGYFCLFRKPTYNKQSPTGRKFAQSGVDVMITIFCYFLPIFGEKIGVFLHNQCYDKILAKSSSSLSKTRQYFC
jgi:hypothetical protein